MGYNNIFIFGVVPMLLYSWMKGVIKAENGDGVIDGVLFFSSPDKYRN